MYEGERIVELEGQVKELREALKPFALFAESGVYDDPNRSHSITPIFQFNAVSFNRVDVERAVVALDKTKEG